MSIERIIGIDFGTSTSVIRVKRYRDGKSLGERLDVKEVTFNSMGQSLVPTLIQKIPDGVPYYGYEAQKAHKKSTLFQNFKTNLESPDLEIRKQARSLTEEFFAYMAKQYKDQSSGGFLGEASDIEKTLISYPVKWSEETRAFMLETARKAGFPNVEGMDEAQAAITAVMVQSADNLSKKGYLYDGVPVNILMADMGAGTTDLVLCRYTPGENAGYEVLSAWPKDGNTLFGGGEVERMLQDYLRSKLPEEDADVVMKRCGLDKFKSWKETMVSPALRHKEAVSEFSDFDNWVDGLEIDAEDYVLNRAEFERLAGDYLKGFPELVNGCLQDAGITGSDVDLVLLTGGHSQWYFVIEQLKGGLNQCGEIDLGKIKADSERIIPVPRPQETVALGLVYSPLAAQLSFTSDSEQKPMQQTGKIDVRQETHAERWWSQEQIYQWWEQDQKRRAQNENNTNFIVRACNKVNVNSTYCEVGTPITPSSSNKYVNAKKYFAIPDEEKVFFIYDSSFFGSCKKGFALCSNGIYGRLSKHIVISWVKFTSLEVSVANKNGGIKIGNDYFSSDNNYGIASNVVSILKCIQEELIFFSQKPELSRWMAEYSK